MDKTKDIAEKAPSKVKSYMVFTKFRLSALVVVSAVSGYLFMGGSGLKELLLLIVGGTLVTAASNGSNQIWERELDKKMNRTAKRPLPQGHMSVNEAYTVVIVCLLVGSAMLAMLNLYSALLGLAAFISYVFIYTPMKRKSPWAVFVGAFPGAIPPMLGAVAASTEVNPENVYGDFTLVSGILFFVQFVWQFPHFWAIAWVAFDDYKAGGFSLLPSKEGKSKNSAFQIAVYALLLIPFSLMPWILGWTGWTSMVLATLLGAAFFWYSYKLFLSCEDKDAKRVMFASFLYLPVIQFLYVFDKAEGFIP